MTADFGRTDQYAPDSDLDSDNSKSVMAEINDGKSCEIWLNDWVETSENVLQPDPYWGFAYQVQDIEDGNVFIKFYNRETDLYEVVQLSPSVITNVFRHVSKA